MLNTICRSPGYETHYRVPSVWNENGIYVLEIGYNKVCPGNQYVATRDIFVIHYVLSGKGRFMHKSFSSGDCYIVVPNEKEIVEADPTDPHECAWVVFRGAGAYSLLEKCGLPRHNAVFSFEHTAECAALIQKNLAETPPNFFAEAAKMQAVLWELFAIHMGSAKKPAADYDVSENVARLIEENYQRPLKICEMAEKFHISQSHLTASFKKKYGVPPQEYLLSVRMERAKNLLKNHNTSIKEAALSVGIENPLYFSRLFHKKVGYPPSLQKKQF